jgi:hypothetical protein
LSSCSRAVPTPGKCLDNIKDTRKLLSREEQQQAMGDMSRKAGQQAEATRQAAASRQAEKPKNRKGQLANLKPCLKSVVRV